MLDIANIWTYSFICLHLDVNTNSCVGATVIENHWLPLSRSEGLSLFGSYYFSEMGPLWVLCFRGLIASAGRQESRDKWHFRSRNIPLGHAGEGRAALPHLLALQRPPAIKINLIAIAVVIQFVSGQRHSPHPPQ